MKQYTGTQCNVFARFLEKNKHKMRPKQAQLLSIKRSPMSREKRNVGNTAGG